MSVVELVGQHRHIEQEVLVDDHVDHGKEKLCMCPRSSLRAYVVGRVRGPCCGTCSGPMLWDDMPYPVTDSNGRGPPGYFSAKLYLNNRGQYILALVPGLAAIHFRSGAWVCCYQVVKEGHGRTK